MDELKWAWVLLVVASLVLLIRLAMWFLPAPGWRTEKVEQAAENTSAMTQAENPLESPLAGESSPPPAAAPSAVASAPAPAPATTAAVAVTAPADVVEPPPEFHLRHTRWGMSPAEVRASELDEPLRENEYTLVYATTTQELPCLLTYIFEKSRLARARLAFSDPSGMQIPPLNAAQAQRRFLYLREQLRSRYGEPMQKTIYLPRDVSGLTRTAAQQEELARQYDAEIAEAEKRLQKQREALERRFENWSNSDEMVSRGLAPYERDLKELRTWKQEALDRADQSRRNIQQRRDADTFHPLIGLMIARWPYAREIQNIELRLDCRASSPRLDMRYEAVSPATGGLPRSDL